MHTFYYYYFNIFKKNSNITAYLAQLHTTTSVYCVSSGFGGWHGGHHIILVSSRKCPVYHTIIVLLEIRFWKRPHYVREDLPAFPQKWPILILTLCPPSRLMMPWSPTIPAIWESLNKWFQMITALCQIRKQFWGRFSDSKTRPGRQVKFVHQ